MEEDHITTINIITITINTTTTTILGQRILRISLETIRIGQREGGGRGW